VNINVLTTVTDGSTLDFNDPGLPGAPITKVVVNNGGKLQLAPKVVTNAQCTANNQSSTMSIFAPEVDIKNGGVISGDNNLNAASGNRNGGAIFMEISQLNNSSGSLIVEPGGELTSDVINPAKGRGGVITVVAEGQILVQASQGGTVRGLISSDAADGSLSAFLAGCGRAQITLIATGVGAPAGNSVIIDGTVEQIPGTTEAVMAGIINILAGADASALGNNPPFPNPGLLTRPNPPNDTAKVLINTTGLVNINCRDDGGCETHISGCIVQIEGLVDLGNKAVITNGIPFPGPPESREVKLPVIAEVLANEDIIIKNGGRIFADLREGFRQHKGQSAGLDNIYYNADDPLCTFVVQNPPSNNGPVNSTRGGADICLTARRSIQLDGSAAFYAGPDAKFGTTDDRFNISASITTNFNTQTGGRVRLWQTADDGNGIDLLGNNITASALVNSGNKGGLVEMQAQVDFDVNGVVLAKGGVGATSQGGIIKAQAVKGTLVGTPGGQLNTDPPGIPGVVSLASCTAPVSGFPPAISIPAALTSQVCTPGVITLSILLKPCGGDCFCLQSAKLKNGILTITGHGLKGVTQVDMNANSCNPGAGSAAAILTKSDTQITATPSAATFTVGSHVILSTPGGPSSSCSDPCGSGTSCP
jgi:hypothetical protein